MTAPGRELLGVSAGPALRAVVRLEGGAAPPPDPLPTPAAPDVTRLPGATMEGFAVISAGGARIQLGCARAPSERWVAGLEGVVLERAMSLALQPWSVRPTGLARAEAPRVAGATATERWSGGTSEGERLAVAHVLAFAGPDADAVACSVLCLEPELPIEGRRCDAVAASLAFEGELRGAPPPGLLARAALWSAENPAAALGGLGVIGVVVVLALFARRPQRPTGARGARAARR